jgi:hypothetical protein
VQRGFAGMGVEQVPAVKGEGLLEQGAQVVVGLPLFLLAGRELLQLHPGLVGQPA